MGRRSSLEPPISAQEPSLSSLGLCARPRVTVATAKAHFLESKTLKPSPSPVGQNWHGPTGLAFP